MIRKANCPSCAAPVEFKLSTSLVSVCEFCHTVVARGDKSIEDLGKVADLFETGSPLKLGLKGVYSDKSFKIVGRTQYQHSAGGVWDEWYIAFPNRKFAWLAEAQGKFHLTVPKSLPEGVELPPLESLRVGESLDLPQLGTFSIVEIGRAKTAGAEGEIPVRVEPGSEHNFVDIIGAKGRFGTLDYSASQPRIFLGTQVTLDSLGIDPSITRPESTQQIGALKVSCPQCAGPLELHAPDQTQRVVCPNCAAELDADRGNLRYLKTLDQGELRPLIPLGSKGTLYGTEWTAIGMMTRYVIYDGVNYPWTEYLLYEPREGFRWLMHSDQHWSFVRPTTDVTWVRGLPYSEKRRYKLFQHAIATVKNVVGEFYWKVEAGERVDVRDYINPPFSFAVEETCPQYVEGEVALSEVNYSLAEYLPHAEVEKAFALPEPLPRGSKVAPNQPFPYAWVYREGLAFVGLLLLAAMVVSAGLANRSVFMKTYRVPLTSQPTVIFEDEPLELVSRQNIAITLLSGVNNSWVHCDGDLFRDDTGELRPFSVTGEYYSGVEGGERWTEGSQSEKQLISAVSAGKYKLRLEFTGGTWPPGSQMSFGGRPAETNVTIRIAQGHFDFFEFLFALALLLVGPVCLFAYHMYFERARWADSEYNPYASSSDDDD